MKGRTDVAGVSAPDPRRAAVMRGCAAIAACAIALLPITARADNITFDPPRSATPPAPGDDIPGEETPEGGDGATFVAGGYSPCLRIARYAAENFDMVTINGTVVKDMVRGSPTENDESVEGEPWDEDAAVDRIVEACGMAFNGKWGLYKHPETALIFGYGREGSER